MTDTVFFEITFPVGGDYEVADRHDIEEQLDASLELAGVGWVSGGGTGMGEANIDVEVTDAQQGLVVVRQVLQGLSLPSATVIRQAGSPSVHHPLHVSST